MAGVGSSGVKLEDFRIPLQEIKLGTDDFSPENYIGGGGFGKVYRAKLSISGSHTTAAVKRLDPQGLQGKHEFLNEISMLFSYRHENIISFIGYCDEADEMIVVYDYAANQSLDKYLRDSGKISAMSWEQRLKICIGAARGLDYLHSGLGEHHRIIHRDIKSANILLDENFVAKISDFGLSKIGPKDLPYTDLHTKVAGTMGYCDPNYYGTEVLKKESDVYSFGVVLFEMLCGRLVYKKRGNEEDEPESLVEWVRCCYKDGEEKIIDPRLRDEIKAKSLSSFLDIAYRCIKINVKKRPAMAAIVIKLEEALKFQNEDNVDDSLQSPTVLSLDDPYLDDGPGIEGLQITGDAKPGGELICSGYSVRGTSRCFFRWVRHHQDGTMTYIEGATKPEYLVTVDDVDKLVAVECQPVDDRGREGEMVRAVANQQNKITCDPKMQHEIDKYVSMGEATFNVSLLIDSSGIWAQATLLLRQSDYQVKIDGSEKVYVHETFSSDFSIRIPVGLHTQFILTCSDGSSHSFHTYTDVRMRDTLVLTMRKFQSKALDERRKREA